MWLFWIWSRNFTLGILMHQLFASSHARQTLYSCCQNQYQNEISQFVYLFASSQLRSLDFTRQLSSWSSLVQYIEKRSLSWLQGLQYYLIQSNQHVLQFYLLTLGRSIRGTDCRLICSSLLENHLSLVSLISLSFCGRRSPFSRGACWKDALK